ncbi:MAG: NAD-binding protein [Gordonia sp. (in: high G+C Gram-positive bacteria)]
MSNDKRPAARSGGDARASTSGGPSWKPRQARTGLRDADPTSATIFVILRRMRAPLITIVAVFTIGTLGLSLIPGVDEAGHRVHLTFFDSFYVMSYTATTIGFGETPWPFTVAQRMWVVVCIYLSVIGWAYAIGTLLSLIQDRGYRQVRAVQRFAHKVKRLREPFLVLAGYGRAGALLVQAFDAMGQQVVVLDTDAVRIDELDLGSFHADVPGLAADAGDPQQLRMAGLDHPYCAGVVALTGDDQVNLAVTMTVALLRPDLPVISHTITGTVAEQMRAFGTPTVIDPFDRFGDHLRLALHSPASYQLMTWLEAGPGAALPTRGRPPTPGRWVVCGYGRLGRELARHLQTAGVELTVIDRFTEEIGDGAGGAGVELIRGDAGDPGVLARARLDTAVGLVAGTDDDVANLSALAGARAINPHLYLAGRQNQARSTELFHAMDLDARLVPSEVVAHEVYARISSPLLWRFLQHLPGHDETRAAELIDRLTADCGRTLPVLWSVRLDADRTPAVMAAVGRGTVLLGDLLRRPEDRAQQLRVVPLLLLRADGSEICAPGDDVVLAPGDRLLFAGGGRERRGLESTLVVDSTSSYVLAGRRIAAGLTWRTLSRSARTSA